MIRTSTITEGYAVGLMSGTSVDGIDAALVSIRENPHSAFPSVQLEHFHYMPFTTVQRDLIFALLSPDAHLGEVGQAHVQLGHCFADAVLQLLTQSGVKPRDIVVIGSHGQTVLHYPLGLQGDATNAFTLQIGDPTVIAERTGIDVVSNFRARDVAAGGQGAPLVPYFDYAVFHSTAEHRVLLNIGGIANATIIPRGGTQDACSGFDTGPGNMIIDAAVEQLSNGTLHYDANGAWAASGTIDPTLLDTWLNHPYFRAAPPKSTGREDFGQAYTQRLVAAAVANGIAAADIVRTITAFVAQTIVEGITAAISQPFTLIASGGGVKNSVLMQDIAARLPMNQAWRASDDYAIPSDAKEAMAFAYLAWQFLQGRPTNMPAITGAKHPCLLGTWTPGGTAL